MRDILLRHIARKCEKIKKKNNKEKKIKIKIKIKERKMKRRERRIQNEIKKSFCRLTLK